MCAHTSAETRVTYVYLEAHVSQAADGPGRLKGAHASVRILRASAPSGPPLHRRVKATLSAWVSVDEFSASCVSAFNGPVPGLLGMFGLEGGCVGAGFFQRYALTNHGICWDAFFVSFQGIRKL